MAKIKRIVRIKKRKKRKTHTLRKTILLLFTIVFLLGAFMVYNYSKNIIANLNKIERIDIGENDKDLMINEGVRASHADADVINIALFGMDGRAEVDGSRSDSIILLSIDSKNGNIKLTSILRDTYLKIPDEYYTRINAAYSIGGPKSAVNTINRNFDMNIEDFISVDFRAIADIVDVLGGLTLTVTEDEVDEMNKCILDHNNIIPGPPSPLIKAGTQTCDGRQVLAYSRIRYLGNGDFDRTARQRLVLGLIYNKFKSEIRPELITRLSDVLADDVVTSLSNKEMLDLGYKILKIKEKTPVVSALTDPDFLKEATIDGAMILLPYTLSDATVYLHNFIYGTSDYKPSETLEEISDNLYNKTRNEHIYTIDTGTTIK